MRLNRFFYLIKEGIKGAFSHGFRSFASVSVISACLIIMGSFALVAVNVNTLIEDMEKESQVLVFIDESLSEEDARSLEPVICSLNNVREAQFVSRDEAFENFKGRYDDDALFRNIDSSVLRDRYIIFLNDITLMEYTEQNIRAINGVADVNAYVEIANGFIMVRNVLSIVTVFLVVVLLVVSLFIMANTIKLATFTRREEIAVMKMVGAGNSFIRFPFIIEGLILGALGSVIGFLLEWAVYNFLSNKVMDTLAGNLFTVVPFSQLMNPLGIAFLGVGLLVGGCGGSMAIRNYLKV